MEKKLYPLTNPQKSIYLTEEYYKGTNINNIAGTMTINQAVDFDKFILAIKQFVKQNDSCRIMLTPQNETVAQWVNSYEDFAIEVVDVSSNNELSHITNEILAKPFALYNSYLFQFVVFRFPDNHGGFIVNMHHLISDAWTLGIVVNEIVSIYATLLKGESLEEKSISDYSYLNYIHSEEEYKKSSKYEKDKAYWDTVFSTVPEVATIPSIANNIQNSTDALREQLSIPSDILTKIKDYCSCQKVSVFNFLVAIFSIYISRVSNLDDFCIGTPILNRSNFKEKNTTGMFINTLPLRVTISDTITFSDFLNTIASNSMALLRHQKYAYQSILEDLRKKQSNLPSLYKIMFSYQITKMNEDQDAVPHESNWFFNGTSADDIAIHIFDLNDENKLNIAYDYQTEKYAATDMRQIHARILTMISQVLESADLLLSNIEIVTPDEKKQLLFDFNNTTISYPRDKTIIELFEEQVNLHSTETAVTFENKSLTYSQLNERANQLAHYIRNHYNIQVGDIVGLFIDKSLEMIIAMYAILKAGGTFLPLDTELPTKRLRYILDNSAPKLILTSQALSLTAKNLGTPSLEIDLNNSSIYSIDSTKENLPINTTPEDLIYIIYTSGSTGTPKGVMVKQRNIVRLVKNPNFLTFEDHEIMVQTGTIVFDACIFEIFGSLLNGFELYILKKEEILDFSYMKSFIAEKHVSILFLTTGLLNQLANEDASIFNGIRYLLTGGDVISPIHVAKIYEMCPNIRMINCYGPTENGSYSTCYPIPRENLSTNIPIGKPISNSSCYVVSKCGSLQPIGVPGELWVSGDGIAKGYINRNDLTIEKFVPNLFGDGLIYKTGDLVKYLPDGNILFLSRIDKQIKLRGFRIELEEIDTNILKFSDVKQSISVLMEVHGQKAICSYITSDKVVEISELKSFLATILPDYMIPKYLVQLDSLPLNISGKIDRSLLPIPTKDTKEIVPARNELDTMLVTKISKLLSLNNVSITDSFFEIGGDSLSAISLVNSINSIYHVDIAIRDIFKFPVIEKLSDLIATKQNISSTSLPIKKAEKSSFYPLSSAQKRIYYASSMDSDSLLYNIAGGIILDRLLDTSILQNCFETLIRRHNALRTYFDVQNGEVVQIVAHHCHFKLEIETAATDDLNSIYAHFVKPFALNKAPLFRAKAVILKNNKMLLLLDMHHIISDGTSLSILLQELCSLYNGKVLPENQVDYTDFTLWEKEQFQTEHFKRARDFWLNSYQGEIPVLNMPTSFARPGVQSFEGSNYHFQLSSEVFKKVHTISKSLGITPYMFMLAIYYILLAKYTSQDDIIIGTPIAGRELPELSNMIGMFVNTLALRNKIDTSLSFMEFVQHLKENCLDCFRNQIYPFDMLVQDLKLKKDTSRNSLFDIMFIYQNNGYPSIDFENTKASYFIPNSNISKFDLSLEVVPMENEFALRFEYCTKLFDESFIKRLSIHYCNILNIVLENYNIKLANIDMLSTSEKNQILHHFNNTAMDFPHDKTIIDLFEEQVKKNPNRIAIRFEGTSITYEALNKKANQIAYYLISKNVKRNQIIGVLLTRTPELLYAILGILKSGAGYMLIDPSLPYDRILFMLQNANSPYLITNSTLKAIDFKSCLFLDNLHFEDYSSQNVNCFSDNEDSFCVIYTSGSTGTPKGVELKRKGIIHLLKNYEHYLGTNDCKHFLSISSVAFDMFVVENFIPLLSGATVILTNEEEQKIPTFTNNLIEKEQVNFILTTPSRMELLLSNIQNESTWSTIQVIQLGGEVFPDNLVEKMQHLAPNAHIFNGYGPTEITACCSSKEVTDKSDISIGTPFGNTQIFICDKNLNLCPIGIEGELCIGGYGLAKGYINNPDMTKKSFVTNPFGDGLLYKTGDIAKYRNNGEIDYIGRRDFQIKIRGLRVELSEIEKQFLKIPNVKNVAVIYKKEQSPYLVAFFTASSLLDITNIRKTLSNSLPLYMVPKYIIQLDTLPITLNGKVNKKQLETYTIDTSLNNYVAPTTELEKLFCSIWEQLLNTKVGIDNDIFDAGADSLLAIKFKTELLSHNINVAYADIFKYKTIRSLASMHENSSAESLVNYNFSVCNSVLEKNTPASFANMLSSITKINKNNVLLLGANGFVGIHILQELIKQDSGNIYCIVRDKNKQDAKTRFLKTLHFYFDNSLDEYLDKRIFMINGNILHPNFGLTNEDYTTLINSIDVVINAAAMVKHYGNESDFKAMNIDLTQNLIDLCSTYHKRFLHISSLSVSGNLSLDGDFSDRESSNLENMNFTEQNLYIGQNLNNEYVKSKFMAEKLVLDAIAQKQLQAKILRLGNITNRYSDGKFQVNHNENAFFSRLDTFIKLKVIPDNLLDMYIEFTPVDSCAQAIVTILQNEVRSFSVYHLYDYHHVYLEQLLKVLEKKQLPIKIVSQEDFSKHIEQLLKSENSSSTLAGIVNDLGPEKQLDYQSNIHILSDFTRAFLYHVGFEWPEIDEEYLTKYIEYMKKLI